ncbi:ATP-binding cassette domain-containing protein [Nonomuraea ferruginea]
MAAAPPLGGPGGERPVRLDLRGVSVALDGTPIVREADLLVDDGEFVGLVGPNGCGKSTLLRSIYRALRPSAGLITVDGDDVHRLPAREAARRTAVVAQETPPDLDFTVAEIVAMGRTPYKSDPPAPTRSCARGRWTASA